MLQNKKMMAVVGIVIIIVLIVVGRVLLGGSRVTTEAPTEVLPTEELIPTIDPSVAVDLASKTEGREVTLSVNGIPQGTDSIEYSLSYETIKQGIQGVIGTVSLEGGEKSYSKDITLGTCSSGTCTYHDVSGAITLSLKFTGSYGERLFEKEYNL